MPSSIVRPARRRRLGPALALLLLLPTACGGDRTVLTGADRLVALGWEKATGLPVVPFGLVTNHTGRLADGTRLADALLDAGLPLEAIFSPEHGFEGITREGERVYSAGEEYRGVPIHSLYGASTRPDPESLEGLGALVFDIQDVGARFYTYTSTMARTMEAAAASGIPYVVLDRPNPVDGYTVEGPVLEPGLASFVGLFTVPVRHGFTVGEYARWIQQETDVPGLDGLDLRVVRLEGWRRGMRYPSTGLPWIAPSPNMPTPATALVYPGTCLVEGTNLSEGRGTERPFELIGAPWADGEGVAAFLAGLDLPGVRFTPTAFVPGELDTSVEVKWKGQLCRGVIVEVTDPLHFRAFPAGVAVVAAFRRLHPDDFAWRGAHFDRLAGVRWLREGIEAGTPLEELEARWRPGTEAWTERAAVYRIYP